MSADAPEVIVLPLLAVTRPGEAGSVRPRCSSALAFCRGWVILIQFLYLLNFFPVCFNIHFEGIGASAPIQIVHRGLFPMGLSLPCGKARNQANEGWPLPARCRNRQDWAEMETAAVFRFTSTQMRGSYAANSSPFTTLADMNYHPFYFSKLGNPPRNKASIAETKFPVNSFFLFEGSFLSGLSFHMHRIKNQQNQPEKASGKSSNAPP